MLKLCQNYQEGVTNAVLMTTLKDALDRWKQESLSSEVATAWPFSEEEALSPESCVTFAER